MKSKNLLLITAAAILLLSLQGCFVIDPGWHGHGHGGHMHGYEHGGHGGHHGGGGHGSTGGHHR